MTTPCWNRFKPCWLLLRSGLHVHMRALKAAKSISSQSRSLQNSKRLLLVVEHYSRRGGVKGAPHLLEKVFGEADA